MEVEGLFSTAMLAATAALTPTHSDASAPVVVAETDQIFHAHHGDPDTNCFNTLHGCPPADRVPLVDDAYALALHGHTQAATPATPLTAFAARARSLLLDPMALLSASETGRRTHIFARTALHVTGRWEPPRKDPSAAMPPPPAPVAAAAANKKKKKKNKLSPGTPGVTAAGKGGPLWFHRLCILFTHGALY